MSGPQFYIVYNASTGDVNFNVLADDGKDTSTLAAAKWAEGWSTVDTFNLGLERYLLVYNKDTGQVRIDRLRANGTGSDNIWEGTWSPGWSVVRPIGANNYQADHVIVYNRDTGDVRFDRFNSNGEGTTNKFAGAWSPGWTHLMPYRVHGSDWRFLVYNQQTGAVRLNEFDNPAAGSNTISVGQWSPGWTHFMPYPKNHFDTNLGHRLLAYNQSTGEVHFDHVSDDGFEILDKGNWAPGWSSFCPVLRGNGQGDVNRAGMIAYNMTNGEVHSDSLG